MPIQTNSPPLPQKIEKWISTLGITTTKPLEVLAGDGSQRTFYRLHTSESTWILLSDPEWALSKDYASHQAFLEQHKISVPRFRNEDPKAGFMLMEDLGDELLQNRMAQEPEKKLAWMKAATEILAHLHGRTFPVPSRLPVAQRSFDGQKYFDELCFTVEHLHVGFLGLPKPNEKDLSGLRSWCDELAQLRPLVFAHRDYHCRNILVVKDRLFLIDFQDARLGPPHYDLASLIYDAYVPITEMERETLLVHYQKILSQYPVHAQVQWKTFGQDLKAVAFQRVIKAAGSFASFYTRFGKSTHLKYLKPALNYGQTLLNEGVAAPKKFDIPLWLESVRKKCQKIA